MDTPFAHRLHTNTVPSDEQCGNIHAFLESPRQQLAGLDKEILRLQRLLEETIEKRDQLKDFFDAHLALVSPVRRLPDDMLRAIFYETLPSTRNSALSPDESPLLLSRISKLWRRIALTTPRIWASLYIVIPDEDRMDRLLGLVQTWLHRSGNVPLAISIVLSRAWTIDCDASALFALLISAANRWKSFQVSLPQHRGRFPFSELRPQDVPLLETLKLFTYTFYPMGTDNLDDLPVALLGASTLRNLHFHGSQTVLPGQVSWANLQELTLSFSGTGPFHLSLLEGCQALQYLGIVFDGAQLQDLDPPAHISLPQLAYLSITTYGPDLEGQRLYEHLSLPTLRSLELHPPSPDLAWLQDFTHTLVCLKIDIYSLVSDTVIEALSTLPNLEELWMTGEPIVPGSSAPDQPAFRDPDFLMRLSPSLSATPTLPLLQHIEFGALESTLDEDILKFVRARTSAAASTNNVAPLRRAVFHLNRGKVRDLGHELRDAVASGLALSVSYSEGRSVSYSPLEGIQPTPMVTLQTSTWYGAWQ